jgi:hypothetical protein
MNKNSKSRLTTKQLSLFDGESLFDRIGRAVCRAGTLPAKELYEAWEVARRVRRKFRGGRVVDLACGHALLGHIMLLLDDSSECALCVDTAIPANARKLSQAILDTWPRLTGRIHHIQAPIDTVELHRDDLVMSVHGCGTLTDAVLYRAVQVHARVAVLPCCHDLEESDTGGLEGWMNGPLAVDATRAARLRDAGYAVLTRTIPEAITPKNRLLMGHPDSV